MASVPLHILVADDEPFNVEILQVILETAGHRVATAENGQEAVREALAAAQAGDPFDLLLLDVTMPVMNGLEAVRQLRADPATAGWPIVSVSAKAGEGHEAEALRAGSDAYWRKPLRRKELLAALEAIMQHRGRRGPDAPSA
jgi:CheY-like chemotaxis protein